VHQHRVFAAGLLDGRRRDGGLVQRAHTVDGAMHDAYIPGQRPGVTDPFETGASHACRAACSTSRCNRTVHPARETSVQQEIPPNFLQQLSEVTLGGTSRATRARSPRESDPEVDVELVAISHARTADRPAFDAPDDLPTIHPNVRMW